MESGNTHPIRLSDAWTQISAEKKLLPDNQQNELIEALQELQDQLQKPRETPSLLSRWFQKDRGHREDQESSRNGLYIWGDVGRGKTLIMDLFFETLNISQKKRTHFHRMMRETHQQLKKLSDAKDPLQIVAKNLAANTRVLCFDEFYVSDIADAMILGRLLHRLFDLGVVIVATSNLHPDELYRDGLQRQRFLPAIKLLKSRLQVHHLGGDTDYRARHIEQEGTYLLHTRDTDEKLLQRFYQIASSDIHENSSIMLNHRQIPVRCKAKAIIWFSFDTICEGPRSQEDYIELARWFPAVIVSEVPQLNSEKEDAARRFIALVDEFYDHRVKLIISAAVALETLYTGHKLSFEFKRTISRLTEMRTPEYLHAPHIP